MKKIVCLTFMLFLCFVNAQNENSLALYGGYVESESPGVLVNYTYSSDNSNYEIGVLHSMFVQDHKDIKVKFSNTALQLGYLQNVHRSISNAVAINLGAGLFVGYEKIPDNKQLNVSSESGIIYGLYGAGQLDIYVSDFFALVLRAQQNYTIKSKSGDFNPLLALGIKINF